MAIERRLTMENYRDCELFGPRPETIKLIEKLKAGNDSECIIFSKGMFASPDQLKLKNLIGTDKRLISMIEGLGIRYALPIQRYSWPKIHGSNFTTFYVSGEATGKTYAILLYCLTKCLNAAPITEAQEILNEETRLHVTNENYNETSDLISHPKYVIICSTQDKVESVYQAVDHIKDKVYGDSVPNAKRHSLTPITFTVKSDHDNDKLSSRCLGSDILIASPRVLIKCLDEGFVDFARFKKVFFDDLDVALQLQSNCIRNLIKIYIRQVEIRKDLATNKKCQLHIFSRKWTALVNQVAEFFDQRTLLFGSISEAAVYSGTKFEVKSFKKNMRDKISVLSNLIEQSFDSLAKGEKMAIVCNTGDEAKNISSELIEKGFKVKFIMDFDEMDLRPTNGMYRGPRDNLFILSDQALEIEVEPTVRGGPLNNIAHLVHASLPDDMLTFDQRFRLLHENIKNDRVRGGISATSTLVLGANTDLKLAKQIYDLASRSQATINSTRCELRDFISKRASQICWRWATTGVCRYEKLSQNDQFGSFCLNRHPIKADLAVRDQNWPESGLVRITITHIISPSEFYFIFDAVKMYESGIWTCYKSSGTEFIKKFQRELNALKTTEARSIPLNKIMKGKIYAVFFPQESRVDRVRILEEPKHEGSNSMINRDLEYNKLIPVFKIDRGESLDVYVKNLVELPSHLAKIQAQCHRGFHLGYKPPDNDPDWLYKSKKHFYDLLSLHQKQKITAWIRLNYEGCFWFEGMLITRELDKIDTKHKEKWTIDPYEDLKRSKLAEASSSEPPILPASTRLETLCRWNHTKLIHVSQYAFLKSESDIYVLRVLPNLDIIVRQTAYNKQLIALEAQLIEDFHEGKLKKQEYLAPGVICIANIKLPKLKTELILNRVKVLSIKSGERTDQDMESTERIPERHVSVYCLDHGDELVTTTSSLYQALSIHIQQLPFQAIKCELANLNQKLLETDAQGQRSKLKETIYDLTRDEHDNNKKVICRRCKDGGIILFISGEIPNRYDPLHELVEDKIQLKLHDQQDLISSEPIVVDMESESDLQIDQSDWRSLIVLEAVHKFLLELAEQSLLEAKLAASCL